jgi:hypothetical protein
MKDLVAATDIGFCSWALLYERPFVSSKTEDTFSCGNGVLHGSNVFLDRPYVRYHGDGNTRKGLLDSANCGMLADRFINVKFGDHT